jgi:hypothetical protein
MGNLRHARCFRDLLVYQKAKEVAASIFKISKNLTTEQEEILRGQLREIGRMINVMITKAHLFCKKDIFMIQEETNTFQLEDY